MTAKAVELAPARQLELDRIANDIPLHLARAAHAGTSHTPDARAESERAGYANTILSDWDSVERELTSLDNAPALHAAFREYREGYRVRYLAMLLARSRCMSTMITGGSNFPVRRQEKLGKISDKRTTELLEFRARSLAELRKIARPELRPIMAGDSDATDRIRAKLAEAEQLQEKMTATNAAIRKHAKAGPDAQLAALVALGHAAPIAAELLKPDSFGNVGFAPYQLTNNNATIKRLRGRLESVSTAQATPTIAQDGSRARFEDAPADNRVRLFYTGKPDAETRSRLKAAAFRWTPSLGCWQAYRNPRSIEIARREAGIA